MRPPITLFRALIRASARGPKGSPAQHIPATTKRSLHSLRTSATVRPSPLLAQVRASLVRFESSSAPPQTSTQAPESRLDREQIPSYELTFTCNVCKTRSSHRLSKQGYHHGTILISCPDCKNRHLISDHLKIFSDKSVTIEDLMREKGDLVKKGSLSAEGDVEFYEDGSTSHTRSAQFHPNSQPKGDERFVEQPTSKGPSPDRSE